MLISETNREKGGRVRINHAVRILTAAAVSITALSTSSRAVDSVAISCVGNSITRAFDTDNERNRKGYPAFLYQNFNSSSLTRAIPTLTAAGGVWDTVYNRGYAGACIQQRSDYWYDTAGSGSGLWRFKWLMTIDHPKVVTIDLGTNDSKQQNWAAINGPTQFPIDYQKLIDTIAHLPTHPKILLCLCTATNNTNSYGIKDSVLYLRIFPLIRQLAAANNFPVIDLHTMTLKYVGQASFWRISDNVHPDSLGQRMMADAIYEAIVNSNYLTNQTVNGMPFKVRQLWFGLPDRAKSGWNTIYDSLSKPMLFVFPADSSKRNGYSALICPGGGIGRGYSNIAIDTEGFQAAKWLNKYGITAFVLRYRISPSYQYPVPMLDVSRAMRLIRYAARDYNCDTTKIGVVGLGAGGHLASWLGTHSDNGTATSLDSIERKKSRPDWTMLAYPLITMSGTYADSAAKTGLLGGSPAAATLDTLSNQNWVTAQTPKTFVAYGGADNASNQRNAIMYDSVLKAKGVAEKLYLEPGKTNSFGVTGSWPDTAILWLLGHVPVIRHPAEAGHSATDFSVGSTVAGFHFSAQTSATAVSVYSLNGKRQLSIKLKPHGSFNWRPPVRGVYIVRWAGKGLCAVKTAIYSF